MHLTNACFFYHGQIKTNSIILQFSQFIADVLLYKTSPDSRWTGYFFLHKLHTNTHAYFDYIAVQCRQKSISHTFICMQLVYKILFSPCGVRARFEKQNVRNKLPKLQQPSNSLNLTRIKNASIRCMHVFSCIRVFTHKFLF